MGDSCVFCRIIAGTEPGTLVREWPDAVAFLPLDPVTGGHVLVVPRVHVADAAENPAVTGMVFARAAELAGERERDGAFNLITSRGAVATQTVFHLHAHVTPRAAGDGLPLPWTPQQAAARAADVDPTARAARRAGQGGAAMSPRTRLRIAQLLDRLPGQCWTDLVWWYTTPDRPVREAWSPISGACRADARAAGRCYCNKIAAGERRRPWPLWVRVALLVVLGVATATLLASSAVLLATALVAPLPSLREVEYSTVPDPEIGRHGCDQCVNGAVALVEGDPHGGVSVEAGGLACGFCAAGLIQHAVDQLRPDGVVRVTFFAHRVCTACWRPGGGHWPDCPAGGR